MSNMTTHQEDLAEMRECKVLARRAEARGDSAAADYWYGQREIVKRRVEHVFYPACNRLNGCAIVRAEG